jgi:hypothetical protein
MSKTKKWFKEFKMGMVATACGTSKKKKLLGTKRGAKRKNKEEMEKSHLRIACTYRPK